MTLNDQIKDSWEQEPVSAPMPHAEELTIRQLADKMGRPVEQVLAALQQEGLSVEADTMTITALSATNRRSPSDIYAAIQRHFPESEAAEHWTGQVPGEKARGKGKDGGSGPGKGQGRGMGRKSRE